MAAARILIVEDEYIVATGLKHRLEAMGYAVYGPAATGRQAVELALAHKPDLVLMDVVLKGALDGVQTAKIIGQSLTIPVVFLTAHGDEESLNRAKEVEPYGYLTKPFQPQDLQAAIEIGLAKATVEARARQGELFARAVLDSHPAQVAIVDDQARLVAVNQAWRKAARLYGPKGDCLGLDFLTLCDVAAAEPEADAVSQATAEGLRAVLSGSREEFSLDQPCRSSRRQSWFTVQIRRLDWSGPPRFLVSFNDVTALKKAEERVQRAKQDWERTFDAAPDMIAIIDRDYRFVRVNKALAAQLGLKPGEMIGQRCYDLIHHGKKVPPHCPHTMALADRQVHWAEITEEKLGGTLMVKVSPLKDHDGLVTGSVYLARDISALKRTERESKRLISQLQEALRKVKGLSGLAHICPSCRRIMNEQGDWEDLETILHRRLSQTGVAPICPNCAARNESPLQSAPKRRGRKKTT